MAVLNDSTDSLSTAVWGRRFQSTVVRGENEAFLCCVLHSGTWYDRECMFLECLRGGESLWLLLTATLSWEILYIMTRRASLRRSSRLRHARCCSMSPTLDVLRWLLVTYLAALRWTISMVLMSDLRWGSHTEQAYSRDDLTNDLYACSLTEVEPMFRLRRRKPRVLLALVYHRCCWCGFPIWGPRWLLLPDILPYQQIPRHDREGNIWILQVFYYVRWYARYIYLGGKPSSIIVPTVLVYRDLFAGLGYRCLI